MLRPWNFNMEVVRHSGTPIHIQIVKKIIEEIKRGRLNPGLALPGTRELSSKLNINRKTVVQAYDELIASGWLTTQNKRGTFVSLHGLTVDACYADKAKADSDIIRFDEELPDLNLMPYQRLSRAMRHAILSSARLSKQYQNDPRGASALRQAIIQMLNIERGFSAELDNICTVRGGQMGVFLVARYLYQAGDYIVVEQLSDPTVRETFKNCGARILTVAHNQHGIDIDQLEKLCINHRVRAIYVTPHHQSPTAVCIPLENRTKLLKLANKYDVVIVEHDSGYELEYSQQKVMPIASQDNHHRVIYIGSFSNVLTPDLRLGYIVAAAPLIHHFAADIAMIDRQGSIANELAVAELLCSGEFKRHVSKVLNVYLERKNHICSLIDTELAGFATFNPPSSGLGLWLNIAPYIDINLLMQDANNQHIILKPPHHFAEIETNVAGLRLNYAHLSLDEITLGIKRLKNALLSQTQQALSA